MPESMAIWLARFRRQPIRALATLCCLASVAPGRALAAERLPAQLEGVTVRERLGRSAALDARFRDHDGRRVQLRDYLDAGKPVLLTLNYYRCRTLCSLQLNALTRGLRDLGWPPGEQFRIVTISINPTEGPELAREKRQSYLNALGMAPDADWSFLTGARTEIDKVARSVGFSYRYLPDEQQYAHPAVIFFITPTGTIARYLYGLAFPAQQIKFALVDASHGRVGSTVDKLILSCFHYDDTTGAYGPFALGIMRLGGAITAALVAAMLLVFWRRERRRARSPRWSAAQGDSP